MTFSEDVSTGGTILVVDDAKDSIRLLGTFLHNQGYCIRFAFDGLSAVSLATNSPPDIILLDILLPDISGYEVCRRLKAEDATRGIPVIFISALEEPLNKIEAFRVGGADYLMKPYHDAEVLARLESHLRIARLQARLRQEVHRLEVLEQAVFEGVILVEQGVIRDVNSSFCELLGMKNASFCGRRIVEFVEASSRDTFLRWLDADANGVIDVSLHHPDGAARLVEMRGKSLVEHGQQMKVIAVRDMTAKKALEQENRAMRLSFGEPMKFGELVGKSAAMRAAYEQMLRAANSEYPVLILGETGTGKELAAREIHRLSERRQHPFLPMNCGAMPENLFESLMFGYAKGAFTGAYRDQGGFFDRAGQGTLFLDEVGELTPEQQVKLLRTLQDGEYTPVGGTPRKAKARIIAATNRDLRQLLAQKRFRDDFFYRISVLSMTLPPLRERKEDLPLLIWHIFEQEGVSDPTLPPDLYDVLAAYDWPGNVRELQTELKRYLVSRQFSPHVFAASAAAPRSADPLNLPDAVTALEHRLIVSAIEHAGGERSKAAQLLGIDRKTLYRKLKEYRLE